MPAKRKTSSFIRYSDAKITLIAGIVSFSCEVAITTQSNVRTLIYGSSYMGGLYSYMLL